MDIKPLEIKNKTNYVNNNNNNNNIIIIIIIYPILMILM